MTFLAPLFLLGLAALAIPILIHLTHRERKDAIAFPSLMFLRRIPYRTQRRQRIRHWLLFLLRAAAVLLATAAFARPLLEGAGPLDPSLGAAREVVVLLDRSYSMEYDDRWARAVREAGDVIDQLGPDDRASLVLFSDRAEVVTPPTGDRTSLRAALGRARAEGRGTRLAPALELARDLMIASDRPRRVVILISDLQRRAWDRETDLRLPAGTDVSVVDLSVADPANLAVTEVVIDRSHEQDRGRLAVVARLANTGTRPVTGARVALEVAGTEVRTATVSAPPSGAATVRFEEMAVPAGPTRARVRLPRDRLPRDDDFHFMLGPATPVRILVIEDAAARRDESLYLRRALGLGRTPPFDLTVRRGAPTTADLDGRDVIVVNDATLSDAATRRVRGAVNAGAGLLVVLGSRGARGLAAAAPPGLLRATTVTPVDRLAARGATISVLDYAHPAFTPFRTPRSGDVSATRAFRYWRVEAADSATVLARFDDGAPALLEAPARDQRGRVLLWTSDLTNTWNDLPVQPIFLPLLHQIVRYLASYAEPPAWYTVGQAVDLAAVAAAASAPSPDADRVLESPSGSRAPLSAAGPRIELDEPGFYLVRRLDGADREALALAVNLDVGESDLTAFDRDEIVAALTPLEGSDPEQVAAGVTLTPAERERRQGLWWYLLVAVVLLLAAETAVAYHQHRVR